MDFFRHHGVMATSLAGLTMLVLALNLGQDSSEQAGAAAPPVMQDATPALPAAALPKPAPPPSAPVSGHAALVVDRALLDLFHAYLLEQSGPARADALRLHLKQTLAPGAYLEAAALVERYLAYMAAHDALLTVQDIKSNDLRRIAVWCDQRDRLRQRMLGSAVTQAWYGQEDAQLKRIVDEAALAAGAADADAQPYDLLDQTALDQAVKSFAALASEGPAWSGRHAAYLAAKNAITQNAGLDESERSIRIRELLLRAFASEAERFRARSLEND